MKKIVSIVLSLIMVLSLSAGLDFSAYADSTSNGFTYVASNGYAIITGYNNKDIDVLNIPSKIYDAESGKDLTVACIGENAFKGYKSLYSITLPDSLTGIGIDAFDGTAYYNRLNNWQDGYLYCSNYLLDVDSSKTTAVVKADTLDIAQNVAERSLEYIGILGKQTRANCKFKDKVIIGCYPDSVAQIRAYELGLKYYDLSECTHDTTVAHKVEPTCAKEGANEIRCVRCNKLIKSTPIAKVAHSMVITEAGTPATDNEDGWTDAGYCSVCGYVQKREFIEARNHHYVLIKSEPATCEKGWTDYYKCSVCGDEYSVENQDIPAAKHDYVVRLDKATFKVDGNYRWQCTKCGAYSRNTIIPLIYSVSLTKTAFTYNNTNQKPVVKALDSKRHDIPTDYYNVSYPKNCKNVGEYSVKVKFSGRYYGEKTLTYVINPKNTSVKSLKSGKKSFAVNIKKYTTQTTGYRIQYSTDKNFKNAKTVTVSNKTTTKTVKSLKSKKKYYVRLCTYKTVDGKKYCSKWSSTQSVKTK